MGMKTVILWIYSFRLKFVGDIGQLNCDKLQWGKVSVNVERASEFEWHEVGTLLQDGRSLKESEGEFSHRLSCASRFMVYQWTNLNIRNAADNKQLSVNSMKTRKDCLIAIGWDTEYVVMKEEAMKSYTTPNCFNLRIWKDKRRNFLAQWKMWGDHRKPVPTAINKYLTVGAGIVLMVESWFEWGKQEWTCMQSKHLNVLGLRPNCEPTFRMLRKL